MKKKRPSVTLAHQLPWRARFLAPSLAGHAGACERIANALALVKDCDRVRVRLATGSIIVESRETALDAQDIAERLGALVRKERDENGQLLADRELTEGLHGGPTRLARAVAHAFGELNTHVRATLEDEADLGTLMPVFFAMGGLSEVATTNRLPTPPWFNLLWWSIRSFMTFNTEALREETRARKNGAAEPRGPHEGHDADHGHAPDRGRASDRGQRADLGRHRHRRTKAQR